MSSGGSSPPLVPVETEETLPSRETEVEVKPDPDALEEEVNIKDWKPDVSLSYKGKRNLLADTYQDICYQLPWMEISLVGSCPAD
jgi:hypothetical protein